jgi:putative acetyltransferase
MSVDHYDEAYRLWRTGDGIGLSGADSKENIAKFLERNPGFSFVAIINKKIIGAVLGGHDGRRGHVYHLFVDPDRRSAGIGRALAGKCMERFKEAGIEKSHVFVFKDNDEGIGFWKKAGCRLRDDILLMSVEIK